MDERFKTWTAIGVVLGIHPDTILRARRKAGESPNKADRPWFESEEAVIAWWKALRGSPATSRPAARSRRSDSGEAFDRKAMAAELLGGRK